MDLHRQYFYSAHFPGIFATLYEHGQHRYEYRYKISDLTEEEFPPNSLSGEKYLGGCDYMKIDYDIITCNSEIAIIDARQAASPLGEEIVGSNECKSCKKPFPSEYDLLNHVARAKKCMPSYAAEIANFRAYIKRQKDASYAENPNSKSTNSPQTFITICSSLDFLDKPICMKAFRMSILITSYLFQASMVQVINTLSVRTVVNFFILLS